MATANLLPTEVAACECIEYLTLLGTCGSNPPDKVLLRTTPIAPGVWHAPDSRTSERRLRQTVHTRQNCLFVLMWQFPALLAPSLDVPHHLPASVHIGASTEVSP
jgi:hypothetical protein